MFTLNRSSRFVALAAGLSLVAGAGLFAWWNTDVLGREEFCQGALTSSEMDAVLEGPGRPAQMTAYEERDPYGFSCAVQRTSKWIGGDQTQMAAELSYDSADFALRSRMWKDPSANSYFIGGATGAVSESQAVPPSMQQPTGLSWPAAMENSMPA